MTFFNISQDNVSSTIASMSGIITDLMPLWVVLIGIFAGLIVFEVIVGVIRGRATH